MAVTAQNISEDGGPPIESHKLMVPRAWSIADLSQTAEERGRFVLTGSHIDIVNAFMEATRKNTKLARSISWSELTDADRLLQDLSISLKRDPIGGEDFHTMIETQITAGLYGSMHSMVLGGRDKQKLHYHPPGDDRYPESSIRHVILYPLHNKAKSGDGGITFEWFQTTGTRIVKPDNEPFPHAEGVPVGEKHVLHLEPGQIALVAFPKGIHHFVGDALARSVHFMDVDTGSRQGSFLGNTAGYEGDEPQNIREIILENGSTGNRIRGHSLRHMWTEHGRIDRRYVEQYAGQVITEEARMQWIEELRY